MTEEVIKKETYLDLHDIFNVLWKKKFQVLIFSLISAIFSLFYSFSLNDYYNSSATIQMSADQESSSISPLGGLASIVGISSASGGDKFNYASEVLMTRSFFKHLIEKEPEILPNLTAFDYFDKNKKISFFDDDIYKEDKWIEKKPSYLEGFEEYKNIFIINPDQDLGFIKVSVIHESPYFSRFLIDVAIRELNNLSKNMDISDAKKSIEYLEKEFNSTSYEQIKLSINNLITKELEKLMVASVKNYYLVKYIEPPFLPERKSGPTRSLICIFITFLGFMSAVFFILIKEFIFKKT